MKKLLLFSSSRIHGGEFLEHGLSAIQSLLAGRSLLFVPFALADHDQYESIVRQAVSPIDVRVSSLHRCEHPRDAIEQAAAIFIGGGNTFRLLKTLYELDVVAAIRSSVLSGTPYMGSSAGTNLACPTIRTTNDMPIAQPPTFDALNLLSFQINPHYIDADPNSTHQGETRERRIQEYLEENEIPVLGMREGSWLEVNDQSAVLCGSTGAVWFERGREPVDVEPGWKIDQPDT